MSQAAPQDPAALLLQRVLAQREITVALADGRRSVTLRRPPSVTAGRIVVQYVWAKAQGLKATMELLVPEVKRAGIRWEGWTEADVLGPAIGSDAAAPWSAELWGAVLEDDTELCARCVAALGEALVATLEAQKAAEKN